MRINVLFVCLGNICRSPMAEAVFQQMVNEANLAEQIKVDSAGTGSWHVGEPAHPGTLQVLRKHGIHYDGRARQVRPHDLTAPNTYVIAMDQSNLDHLHRMNRSHPQMHRLLDFANRETGQAADFNVPDPYYTGNFDAVHQMVAESCANLLATIRQQEGIG
jgi:protein-tyrosine phosphatase